MHFNITRLYPVQMSERHPARNAALAYVQESLSSFAAGLIVISIITSPILSVALAGSTRTFATAIVANVFVTVFFTQYTIWDPDSASENDSEFDFSSLGPSEKLLAIALVAVYLNGVVLVALAVGSVVPSAFTFGAAGLYVLYDLISVRFGVPISMTGAAAIGFALGGYLAEVLDSIDWGRTTPADIVSEQLRRREVS